MGWACAHEVDRCPLKRVYRAQPRQARLQAFLKRCFVHHGVGIARVVKRERRINIQSARSYLHGWRFLRQLVRQRTQHVEGTVVEFVLFKPS